MKLRNVLTISLVGFVVVVVTACAGGVSPETPEVAPEPAAVVEPETQSDSAQMAANPELMAAGRFAGVGEEETSTGSTFYAANPELMTVTRNMALTGGDEPLAGSALFAANPELMAAQRFSAGVE